MLTATTETTAGWDPISGPTPTAASTINQPLGSVNYPPHRVDDHYYFNSLAKGDNNNRWPASVSANRRQPAIFDDGPEGSHPMLTLNAAPCRRHALPPQ